MPGLIAAYFLSRPGQRTSYARSATPLNLDLDLRLNMGHEHGGLTDATACNAGKRKTTLEGHTGEPEHRGGYQSKYASSCSMRSTLVNRSGRPSEILD